MHIKLQTGLILFFCTLNTSAVVFQSYFRLSTDITPKDSCLRVDSIKSILTCFLRCFSVLGFYHMISFNNDQQTCLCCEDLSGSDVTSPGWKTYLPNRKYSGYDIFFPYTTYTNHWNQFVGRLCNCYSFLLLVFLVVITSMRGICKAQYRRYYWKWKK